MIALFTPPDVDAAYDAWGATCGPCALAAALGVPVEAVRDAVSKPSSEAERGSEFPGYMGIGDIRRAVQRMGASIGEQRRPFEGFLPKTPWLVMVNWIGPWSNTRGQASYRHIIAVRQGRFEISEAAVYMRARSKLVASDAEIAERWKQLGADVRGTKVYGQWVYDCNAGWLPFELWTSHVMKSVMPARATKAAFVWGGEVLL